MAAEDADEDRLTLAEVTCRISHVTREARALAERRSFPGMPDDRRAAQAAELETERAALQRRHDELAGRVPDPEQVRAPDMTLPAERRESNLAQYRIHRRERLRALVAKVAYLDTILADKAAPKNVRRRVRDARAAAVSDIDVLNEEPTDEDLRPAHMCPDGVHLASSHGYVWTSSRPAWPCAAWPGQRRKFEEIARLLFSETTSTCRDDELIRWQLTLYCGHIVERTAHKSYATYDAAGGGLHACEECAVDPAFVVEEKSLGPVTSGPPAAPSRTPRPKARKALERRAAKLDAELSAIRTQLEASD